LKYSITIKNILFSLGLYSIDLTVSDFETKTPILRINNFVSFQVESKTQMWVPIELDTEYKVE
jgi:lipopolysaccharide transport system ATP-binding protein